jgi:dipeptidyl aminopeptidase/acylaminoacyl peptidase
VKQRARLVAAALAAVGYGCIGAGFDLAELPPEPLAIVYRTRDESERRVDLLKHAHENALKHERTDAYESSFLRLDAAVDALGLGRSREEKAADLLGRMVSLDGRTEQVEPFEFAFRGDRPLAWSADHGRLLFASLRSDTVQVYEWNRKSGEVHPVTWGPEEHAGGCYLPGGRLALAGLVRSPDGKKRVLRLYVTESGGAQPRPITPGPSDAKPACAPDGSVIAYETLDANGRPAIALVSPSGEGQRVVAPGRDPTFTPDGAFIVYSARTRAGWRLYEMHPDGSAKRPLGGGPKDESDPQVSPDGRFVAYVSDDEGRQQLRVRTIDGRKDRPLKWYGDGITPVW